MREEVILRRQQKLQKCSINGNKSATTSKCDYRQVDTFMDLIMRANSTPKKGNESDRRKCENQKLKLVQVGKRFEWELKGRIELFFLFKQEWLEQQPLDNQPPVSSTQTTDCEASGEYTGTASSFYLIFTAD